ncbi:MAG TPA: branched-chain amino acid ABC transporter permease [Candidatus Dormibacteraeota bacterium]|nr:branched-chain amino acid ABC transporter permease [Candidatus Dormibacteraeota bacterium]
MIAQAARPTQGRLADRRFWLRGALVIVVLVVGLGLPFFLGAFWLSTTDFILIAAIGALGLNVLTGYTGQVSLGHAFFLGVGAYTAAFLGDHNVNAAIWIPAAGVVAGLVGLLVGPTALRLRGLYLAIVTIGLVFLGTHLFVNLPAITGGPAGRAIAQPQWGPADFGGTGVTVLGISIDRNGLYYYLALLLLALSMWFVHNLMRTRAGRAMQAVRDREVAAALVGVNLARTKLAAFVVSSFLAGICGAVYGAFLFHVEPGTWNLLLSIQFVAIIIVGGIGTVWGALLGSVFISGLPAILNNYSDSIPFLQHSAGGGGLDVGDATDLVYGILIVLFLVAEPRGLIGLVARIARSIPQRRRIATASIAVSPVAEE